MRKFRCILDAHGIFYAAVAEDTSGLRPVGGNIGAKRKLPGPATRSFSSGESVGLCLANAVRNRFDMSLSQLIACPSLCAWPADRLCSGRLSLLAPCLGLGMNSCGECFCPCLLMHCMRTAIESPNEVLHPSEVKKKPEQGQKTALGQSPERPTNSLERA